MRILLGLWLALAGLLADGHIFVYHRFADDRHPATSTSLTVLRKQFDYFKTHGYEVVPLSRIVAKIKAKEPVPNRWVALTIDDSYKSFYENGLPVFKAYGYPFTLFVYTKATDAGYGDFMSWEQVNEAAKYGELGFHSHTHPHMVSQSDARLRKDFEKGLALMIKMTGKKPRYFAYPYGEYDERVRKIAESFGFDAISNQNVGAVSAQSDPYDLDRIALTGDTDLGGKLRLRHLPVAWLAPRIWPKKGMLTTVHIRLDPHTEAKTAQLYLTGYGWRRVPVREGQVFLTLDRALKNRRSRLILKVQNGKISTKILVKP